MNFTDISNIGKEYKDFVIIDIEDIPDYKTKAVYLRHKKTGLEVYHFINDDKENLFSFVFRTLAKDSKGAAHITEHSVLCGSEKFPLKEPFTTLDNQSLHTFLNALTYPEKTMYPAASVVKSDYFNLFDVYADAVFFPKITKQTFMQEGWRLEYDEKGKASIQGVVYNEMKANYSTFNSVAVDRFFEQMYPDSIMSNDSGGDPLDIPCLTYEEFTAFHKKFYRPSNCLLILYGNISTQEQIDFLDEKYISRLIAKYGECSSVDLNNKIPSVPEDLKPLQEFKRIPESKQVITTAPMNGATGNIAGIGWYCGEYSIEQLFLSEVLTGNDSSPMSRKLKDSNLGDDEAPVTGSYGYVLDETLFSFGLSGVKKGNENKVFKLILDSIHQVYEEGVSQKDIDSALMGLDFSLREENRYFGPRSLSIAGKAAASWCCGKSLSGQLNPISALNDIKEKLKTDNNYIRKLIKKYFIDNEICLKFICEPTKKYFDERNKKEEALIAQLEKSLDKETVIRDLDKLHAYQSKVETEEELACIPHLEVKDLVSSVDNIKTEYETINGKNNIKVPLVVSKEDTNGIVYAEILFPIDNLSPEFYIDLPLFAGVLTNLGWNHKNWSDCISECACIMGDLNVKNMLSQSAGICETEKKLREYENPYLGNRHWLVFSGKFLAEKAEECFNLLSEIVTSIDFTDVKRMETKITEYITDRKENFASAGSQFVSLRGRAENSKSGAVQELCYGVTQAMHVKKLSKKAAPKLLKKFESYYKQIFSEGALLHITTDSSTLNSVKKLLPEFVVKSDLRELKPCKNISHEEIKPFIYYPKNYDKNLPEAIQINTQSGYAASFFKCAPFLTKESAAEEILCNYLNSHQLWVKIRMQGGAYGGSANNDSFEQLFVLNSWRDPTPEKSLGLFMETLKEVSEQKFTQEDVDRCILSSYSYYISPDSPNGRGHRGLSRFLYGNSYLLMNEMVKLILQVTPEDVHEAAVRLYENAKTYHKNEIFCDNSTKVYGNIIKIPL